MMSDIENDISMQMYAKHDDEKWKDDPRDHLEFVKRSGATVLGHDECVQSVLDLRLAVKAAVGIHVCKEVIF